MLLQVEMLRGLPVASLQDEAKVATVRDVVLHPDTGELIGFWVQPEGWFTKVRALSSRDVVSYDHTALIIQAVDALVDPNEVQPFANAVKRNERWLGKHVENEAGTMLGTVSDLVIDTDLEMLRKFEVSSLFSPKRLFGREDIVKVTRGRIIVHDDSRSPAAVDVVTEGTA